jgi:prepilin peptidase CpaA
MTDRAALWSLLAVALLISIVTDIATRRIPDWVTFSTAIVALGYRLVSAGVGDLESGFLSGLVACTGAAGFFGVIAWRSKGANMGWGDVKLFAAVGAVLGYPLVMSAVLFITLIGALLALVTLMWKGSVWVTLRRGLLNMGGRLKLTKRETTSEEPHYIPYGVAIALGSFWAMWWEHSNP